MTLAINDLGLGLLYNDSSVTYSLQAREVEKLSRITRESQISMVAHPSDYINLAAVEGLFKKKNETYLSLSYVERHSAVSAEILDRYFKDNPKVYRVSFLKSKKGESVYMLNKWSSRWVDFWNLFTYINHMKTS